MENSFKSVTAPAKSILLILPLNSTFDTVAAATSLSLALEQEQGKEINIFSPSQMIVEYNRLVSVNKIKTEIGNKNLTINFHEYNPQGIEKVSWDIDNGEFKLTVVPKPNVPAPTSDQVLVSYSGVAADLVILVGGKDENDFPIIKSEDLLKVNLAHVGVSQMNINGRTVSSFATQGSSISEVVANVVKANGYKLEADMATNLLMGIEKTTGEFAASNVTADTFSMVSELMRAGGRRISEGRVEASSFPAGAIPGGQGQTPSSWLEPKIFKGTSVS
ncbi:MAG TPA: hypothetical protein VLE44_02370 [Candidatus Saccharimonadales bacterium]|nr:hypothetical protein [Candidatus Saccharimonadales bacterium]